jgi:hypothetical protein
VIDGGVVDDAMGQQWPILHQTEHGVSPISCWLPVVDFAIGYRRPKTAQPDNCRTCRNREATSARSIRMHFADAPVRTVPFDARVTETVRKLFPHRSQ